MMAGVEEKAQLKHSLVVFFVGVIIAYGAFFIWQALVDVLKNV